MRFVKEWLMAELNISAIPEVWLENWSGAAASFPKDEVPFLREDCLDEANDVIRLPDEKMRLFHEASAQLRASEPLRFLAWMWVYTLFLSDDHGREMDTSAWPVPASQLGPLTEMFHGLVLMGGLPVLKRFYESRSIPDEVLTQTLLDVDICMDEHIRKFGRYGIGSYRMDWLLKHFTGKLFRLGRLQFTYVDFDESVVLYQDQENRNYVKDADEAADDGWKPILREGDGVLDVHIPRGGPMTRDACRQAYDRALAFYQKHFPELRFKAFMCRSWMLSPDLRQILPPQSNILGFQEDYVLYETTENEEYFDYVFGGYGEAPLADLPEETTLQRVIKKHLLEGKHIYSANGVMFDQ